LDEPAKNFAVPDSTPTQPGPSISAAPAKSGVFDDVTGYHWLVFFCAAAGWLFDCMGQRIFILARDPAMRELLGSTAATTDIDTWGARATCVMLAGWATGGILFGMMSDKMGRVKTMVATLLAYTLFSGLTGLAHSPMAFLAYRFLGGMGIGGMFGAATTLLAESVPTSVRLMALGAMQALSALGNITGSLLTRVIQPSNPDFYHGYAGWRFVFFVGALPAVLAIFMPWLLKEPEPWKAAKRKAAENPGSHKVGSIAELLSHPVWRKNLFVGVALGIAGMAGLWGIGFFSPELIRTALKGEPQKVVDIVKAYGTTFQDVGAFFGMLTFTFVANHLGRRKAFFGSFILCLGATIYVFNNLRTGTDAYWMLPVMGFAQLSVFGGYSIYFPELFPTRLRGTGISFCYNTVRYLTAVFPLLFPILNNHLHQMGVNEPFRKAATILSFVFLIGLVALIWAPETKGKPLPEG
jgi:MFS family permease